MVPPLTDAVAAVVPTVDLDVEQAAVGEGDRCRFRGDQRRGAIDVDVAADARPRRDQRDIAALR